jgi:hypothetical protein
MLSGKCGYPESRLSGKPVIRKAGYSESRLFGKPWLRLRPHHRLDDRLAQLRAQPVVALDECKNGIGANGELMSRLDFGFFGR